MCGAPPGSHRTMTAVSSSVAAGSEAEARIRNRSGMARAPTPNAPAPRKWRRVKGPGQRREGTIVGGTPAVRWARREAFRREGRTQSLFYLAGGTAIRIVPGLRQRPTQDVHREPADHQE